MLELCTFSIVARCAKTGMMGVSVSTAMPAVGSNCPHAKAGIGAIATQSWVNPYLGLDGIRLLSEGFSAAATLERLLAGDPGRSRRQIGIVDAQHRSAVHSGEDCKPWFGHRQGRGYAVQGNMLTGPETVEAMEATFLSCDGEELPERLMRVLEAGQACGGDVRGKQSAALYVTDTEDYPYVDLRVDEHVEPVAELRRVFEVAKRQLLPFIRTFPTRTDPVGRTDDAVMAMVAKSPSEREG